MSHLLSKFQKIGKELGLLTKYVDINDTDFLSKYFVISEFNPIFGSGKNSVSFNGSQLLANESEIQIECLDSHGNSLYVEQSRSTKFKHSDVSKFLISIHIYAETYNGNGKLILVGTSKKGEIVRWIGNITIDKTLSNFSKVRFYNIPSLEVNPVLFPVLKKSIGTELSNQIEFSSSFYTLAVSPKQDVDKSEIDVKRYELDYRLILNEDAENYLPTLHATTSFNSQLEGQSFDLNIYNIVTPFSYSETSTNITQSFKIKKIIDSKTAILSDAFYYQVGKNNVVSNVISGSLSGSYRYISYNTSSDAYLQFTPYSSENSIQIKESYAEITYRNLRTYSGFIARHKLYRKSLLQSGDYQLIVDEPLGAIELLNDDVTINKNYSHLGEFYNQYHIDKYWFTSSNDFTLTHQVSPLINSMNIESDEYSLADGDNYIILKADSSGSVENADYVPYEKVAVDNLSGSAYNSNFISLKKDALYVLSTNVIVTKNKTDESNLSFYFTSSTESIKLEKNYETQFGLKLGNISVSDTTEYRKFGEKQVIYFTPIDDYYGTIVVVPYKCNATLSEFSLKAYGDYGFSPDVLVTKIPFKVNMANETFDIKAELFDVNSNLVFSNLITRQTFDPDGESLYQYMAGYGTLDPTKVAKISGSLTVSQSLFLPNLESCPPSGVRLVGWHYPETFPPSDTDGKLCTTNVAITIDNENDIMLTSYDGSGGENTRVLAVRFNGDAGEGRKIIIDPDGTKHNYS
jgi:hypothetical protein